MFEALTLREETAKADEERLRAAIRELGDEERADFYREYDKALKDPDTYAVLNWFFLAGLHHFYLGKVLRGMVNLVIMLTGFMTLFTDPGIGMLLLLLVVVIEIPALFRSQIIVMDHNTRLGWRLLGQD